MSLIDAEKQQTPLNGRRGTCLKDMAVEDVKAEDVKAQKTAILMMDEQWVSDDDEEIPANERDEFEKQQQKNEMFVKTLRD